MLIHGRRILNVGHKLFYPAIKIIAELIQIICHGAVARVVDYLGQGHAVDACFLGNLTDSDPTFFGKFFVSNELLQMEANHASLFDEINWHLMLATSIS